MGGGARLGGPGAHPGPPLAGDEVYSTIRKQEYNGKIPRFRRIQGEIELYTSDTVMQSECGGVRGRACGGLARQGRQASRGGLSKPSRTFGPQRKQMPGQKPEKDKERGGPRHVGGRRRQPPCPEPGAGPSTELMWGRTPFSLQLC